MSKIERRFIDNETAQVRVSKREDGTRTLSGYGIVFYDPAKPGTEYQMSDNWYERIAPQAVDESLGDPQRDVMATFNHNASALLGRRANSTLRLFKDNVGVRYEIDLPDTTVANDLAKLVERGDVRGSSFTFRELAYSQNRSNEEHKVWEVTKLELIEIGPVTDPAYTATTAAMRMSDERAEKIEELERQEKAAARRRLILANL